MRYYRTMFMESHTMEVRHLASEGHTWLEFKLDDVEIVSVHPDSGGHKGEKTTAADLLRSLRDSATAELVRLGEEEG
jgi:hypothetical protein